MKKTNLIILGFLFVSSFSFSQKKGDKKNMDIKKVNTNSVIKTESLLKYLPTNYVVLDSSRGDLNLDGMDDIILVLNKINEKETSSNVGDTPEHRPLLLFIGQKNNEYKLVARNDTTVLCVDCGGMMGDPYNGITIKNGYFSVEHFGGSAWRWTRVITYKYSKTDNNWFLHKDGSERFHVSNSDNVEEDIKTTKDFGKVLFENFDIYSK